MAWYIDDKLLTRDDQYKMLKYYFKMYFKQKDKEKKNGTTSTH